MLVWGMLIEGMLAEDMLAEGMLIEEKMAEEKLVGEAGRGEAGLGMLVEGILIGEKLVVQRHTVESAKERSEDPPQELDVLARKAVMFSADFFLPSFVTQRFVPCLVVSPQIQYYLACILDQDNRSVTSDFSETVFDFQMPDITNPVESLLVGLLLSVVELLYWDRNSLGSHAMAPAFGVGFEIFLPFLLQLLEGHGRQRCHCEFQLVNSCPR